MSTTNDQMSHLKTYNEEEQIREAVKNPPLTFPLPTKKYSPDEKVIIEPYGYRITGESEERIASNNRLTFHAEWLANATVEAKQRIASTNGKLPMKKDEYENRKAQLAKTSVDFADKAQVDELWQEMATDLSKRNTGREKVNPVVEPEPVEEFQTTLNLPLKIKYVRPDIFDQVESLKRYVASHITTRDMEPTVNTVYFRIDKTEVVLSQLLPLSHVQHPFDDYTLSYPSLEQDGQFDFVRVIKTNKGYKLHSFSIDIYGTYRFHGQAMVADFYADTSSGMFNIPKAKLTYSNRINAMKYDPYFTSLETKKAKNKVIQAYARLRQFLTDFVLYDREEVTVTKRLASMRHKPRDVQYKHIEYTLDMSKTKRVKYEEQQARIVEEERRKREEHEEMLRREHDRIAHKRRLSDGRVIKVRGTTVCKGSPLGKVTKVYKP